jgi:hypothetical protein
MQTIKEIEKILLAADHKPFVKQSDAHVQFINSQIEHVQRLQKKYPFIHLDGEKKYFEDQLK